MLRGGESSLKGGSPLPVPLPFQERLSPSRHTAGRDALSVGEHASCGRTSPPWCADSSDPSDDSLANYALSHKRQYPGNIFWFFRDKDCICVDIYREDTGSYEMLHDSEKSKVKDMYGDNQREFVQKFLPEKFFLFYNDKKSVVLWIYQILQEDIL